VGLILASFRRQKFLYVLWLVSLCLAVSGLVIVDVYRYSLSDTLKAQGRKILTADASISIRRMLSDDERSRFQKLLPQARTADLTEMFAMVTVGPESRLAMLRFASDEYPLIGDLEIENSDGFVHAAKAQELSGRPLAWVAGDVLALMNTKIGGEIQIGQLKFTIAGTIKKDSSQTFRMGNMAPRIYVNRAYLKDSGLVQFGSTVSDTRLALLNEEPKPGLKKELESQFSDPAIQITVPADLEQGSLRVLSRLLDFLGLTGLITLALGWIGVYYLGRRWLSLESSSAAILKALGVSSSELRGLLLTKLLIVLVSGVGLGGVLAWVGAQLFEPLFRESMPAEFHLVWSWQNTALLLVVGPLAGILLLFPAVSELAFERPLSLFQERNETKASPLAIGFVLVSGSLLFLALTLLQARSWIVTGTFLGALAASIMLIGGLGYGFLGLVKARRSPLWSARLHLLSALWTRRLGTSLLLIMVSALAGLLSQLLPHLEKTLVGELRSPQRTDRPALFMVDIQDEQLPKLQKFLADNGLEASKYSPFIRARILAVNGQNFERSETGAFSTREQEMDARFRNRGVNLSYREKLSDSESILEGKDWKDLKKDPPEISVEEGYAKRLGFKLGDVLKFDIQGIELEAKVASLRKIDWDSFQPNFFIQFPDGVLNQAPKTWVMTLKRHAKLTPVQMQTLVTKAFPNITSINVQEALDNATELIGKLSSGLKISSRLALGLGIFVFLLILMFQLLSARPDWRQLLVLGMTAREVWWLQVFAYGGLCLIGTLIGAALSLAVAWGLFHFAFDSHSQFDLPGMLRIWLITWGSAVLGLGWLGAQELRRLRAQYL
jgi:putative ABC transport system permease protein